MIEALITVAIVGFTTFVITETVDFLLNHLIMGDQNTTPLPPEELIDESLLNEADQKLIEGSKAILAEYLGDQPVENLRTLNPQDRIQALQEITNSLVRLYGVNITGIEFCALPNTTAGSFHHDKQLIRINVNWVMTNDCVYLADLLDTLFHELRHAIQWDIVEHGGEARGVSDARRKELAYNFYHYIRACQDLRGYQTQPVERDAVTFAAMVLRGCVK